MVSVKVSVSDIGKEIVASQVVICRNTWHYTIMLVVVVHLDIYLWSIIVDFILLFISWPVVNCRITASLLTLVACVFFLRVFKLIMLVFVMWSD